MYLGERTDFNNEFFSKVVLVFLALSLLFTFLVYYVKQLYVICSEKRPEEELKTSSFLEERKKRNYRWSQEKEKYTSFPFNWFYYLQIFFESNFLLLTIYALGYLILHYHWSSESKSCLVYHDCYEGPDNSLQSSNYTFETTLLVRSGDCPRYYDIIDYYNEYSPLSVSDKECSENHLGCCSLQATCNTYRKENENENEEKRHYTYRNYQNLIELGYPNGFYSLNQLKGDTPCPTKKDVIQFYLTNNEKEYLAGGYLTLFKLAKFLAYFLWSMIIASYIRSKTNIITYDPLLVKGIFILSHTIGCRKSSYETTSAEDDQDSQDAIEP